MTNSMHDGTVADGDAFLKAFLPQITSSAAFNNSVVFVTFDEGTSGTGGGGHIVTIAIAAGRTADWSSGNTYSHYSILRTVEEAWGLPLLGGASSATAVGFSTSPTVAAAAQAQLVPAPTASPTPATTTAPAPASAPTAAPTAAPPTLLAEPSPSFVVAPGRHGFANELPHPMPRPTGLLRLHGSRRGSQRLDRQRRPTERRSLLRGLDQRHLRAESGAHGCHRPRRAPATPVTDSVASRGAARSLGQMAAAADGSVRPALRPAPTEPKRL